MKTIFDLREKQDEKIYKNIQDYYDGPLNVIKVVDKPMTACIGCWDCWLKTPGKCIINDQMTDIYPEYINSDTVILLMDTAQGFINHQAKAFFDRTIPLYHPYIEMINGECHHVSRYKSYPDMVYYFDTEGLTTEEEQVIEDYLYRTAYHFKSKAYRIIGDENLQLKLLESRKAKRQTITFKSVEPMEKLVIYNGSPRRSGSNSTLILKKVFNALGDRVEVRDLKDKDKWEDWAEKFKVEEHVMLFMPLFIHAMPSHVMKFIEKLQLSSGTISFFIQSGFPESPQSYYLEAYFEQLSIRLERTYLGTVIKGGVEGLQIKPDKSQKKFIEPLKETIVNLVCEGNFNPKHINRLAQPIKFGKITEFIFKIIGGMVHSSWNKQLKENNAYEKRFDCPYLPLEKESVETL